MTSSFRILVLTAAAFTSAPAFAQPPSPDGGAPAAKAPANPNPLFARLGNAPVGGGFAMDGYWVWGSSVAKGDDGLYHMFVSRWPKRLPFHPGWLVASEIVHATAKTIEGPYTFSEVALPARGPQYWDGRSTHNPKILRWRDQWVLFYMGSTNPFDDVPDPAALTLDSHYTTVGRSNKRIGVATAKSPFGPWTRQDAPVLPTRPGTFYSFLTSNPAPYIEKNGSTILVFKGRSHKATYPFHGDMNIGVARAPHFRGPYTVEKERIFGVGKHGEVEDPYIWKDKTGFHLIAKDQRGDITGEKHGGLLAHSKDGVKWTLDASPKAYSKTLVWQEAGGQTKTVTMGQLERAFLYSENGVATHLFFSTMDGSGGFKNGTKSWNMVVPLKSPLSWGK